jgi:hypothetical protein
MDWNKTGMGNRSRKPPGIYSNPVLEQILERSEKMKSVNKSMRYGLLLIVAFLAIGFLSSAQGQVPIMDEKPNQWQFTWGPYIWMTGLNGNVTVKGIDSHVDASFTDLAKHMDMAFSSHVELQKEPWSVYLDPWYAKLSDSKNVVLPTLGPRSVEVTVKQNIFEFGGTYRLGTWVTGSSSYSKMGLELLAGGRYWYTNVDVDLTPGTSNDKSKDWLDPIVGGRLKMGLTEKLALLLRGDIGGFGVGSDFSYNVEGLLSYDISKRFSIKGGYRLLGVDYESGSGFSKLKYDVRYYGPVLGLIARF